MMSGEIKDLDITGLDFPVAVNATKGAAEHIRDFDGVRTNLTMLAAHEDDTGKWKSTSVQILEKKEQHTGLSFKTEVPTDINKLQSSLKMSSLFLLPLKPDSPLFGTGSSVSHCSWSPNPHLQILSYSTFAAGYGRR